VDSTTGENALNGALPYNKEKNLPVKQHIQQLGRLFVQPTAEQTAISKLLLEHNCDLN
jgi:hypothetical protein